MVELMPEERQRIYDEEKARIEARAQIAGEVTAKPKKKPLGCGTFVRGVLRKILGPGRHLSSIGDDDLATIDAWLKQEGSGRPSPTP
ncbi:MAG: hypothetical protein A2W03_13095 [Candidatus Aminicenantes bacterium RBG_16_63_16]|nr:MAG: hypothetical protein A2W03_13095 [Candidatus Aminicenantes bacterium RBG_16_63_16]